MCTKCKVDTLQNDVFIAFETFKMAIFHDILYIIKQLGFSFLYVVLCAQRGSKFIFRAQDDKRTQKHVS